MTNNNTEKLRRAGLHVRTGDMSIGSYRLEFTQDAARHCLLQHIGVPTWQVVKHIAEVRNLGTAVKF